MQDEKRVMPMIKIVVGARVEVPSRRLPVSEWPSGKTYTVPRHGEVENIRKYIWQREPRYYIRTDDGHYAWYTRYQFRPVETRVRRVAWSEIKRARGLDDDGIPIDPVARARCIEARANELYLYHMDDEERKYFLSLLDEHFCMSRAENRTLWWAFKHPRDAAKKAAADLAEYEKEDAT